tara:strand:+ start:12990 stop:13901 length:912 start_codon:yes stop_codon:yes gene_type:complete
MIRNLNVLVEQIHENWLKNFNLIFNSPPQATLLTAPPNSDLLGFCIKLVATSICKQKVKDAYCLNCKSCRSIFSRNYPDLAIISSGYTQSQEITKEEQIKVREINELQSFFNLSSYFEGENRFVVCGLLEKLNYTAINSLLKVLEEPPKSLRFILFANSLYGIPKTIISRCQVFPLSVDQPNYSLLSLKACPVIPWLIPILSKGVEINPIAGAGIAEKYSPHDTISRVLLWMHDVSRCYINQDPVSFPDESVALQKAAKRIRNLFNWINAEWEILEMLKLASHPINKRLLYEAVFMKFRGGFD